MFLPVDGLVFVSVQALILTVIYQDGHVRFCRTIALSI
jgi:hypothetical protein